MRDRFLILTLACAAFCGAVAAGFYLDDLSLWNDPAITSPWGWADCFQWRQTRPLTWFSFWVNYQLGGENAGGYHVLNLLLHLVSVWVAHQTLSRMLPAPAAAIGAGLFALHPIQTEAVVYVFARATLLMTLCCLLSLRQWIAGRYWQGCIWFAAALAGKEECVSFPLFLMLMHISRARESQARERKERMPLLVMLALSLAAGLRVLWVTAATAGSGAGTQAGVAPLDYFVAQGFALWRYARLLAFPYGFTIDSAIDPQPAWLGFAGWGAIAVVAVLCGRRLRGLGVGFWIVGALVLIAPSSSFLPAQDLAADRRVYLPLLAIGAGAGVLMQFSPRWIPLVLALALTLASIRQTLTWRSGEALWREAARLAPNKVRPRIQLARQLPPGEALSVLDEAKKIAPDDGRIASERGRVLLEAGNAAAALAEFGRAVALAPGDAGAINNRGVALLRLGQREAALADFQRALLRDNCLFDARWNLRNLGDRSEVPGHCRYSARQLETLTLRR